MEPIKNEFVVDCNRWNHGPEVVDLADSSGYMCIAGWFAQGCLGVDVERLKDSPGLSGIDDYWNQKLAVRGIYELNDSSLSASSKIRKLRKKFRELGINAKFINRPKSESGMTRDDVIITGSKAILELSERMEAMMQLLSHRPADEIPLEKSVAVLLVNQVHLIEAYISMYTMLDAIFAALHQGVSFDEVVQEARVAAKAEKDRKETDERLQ